MFMYTLYNIVMPELRRPFSKLFLLSNKCALLLPFFIDFLEEPAKLFRHGLTEPSPLHQHRGKKLSWICRTDKLTSVTPISYCSRSLFFSALSSYFFAPAQTSLLLSKCFTFFQIFFPFFLSVVIFHDSHAVLSSIKVVLSWIFSVAGWKWAKKGFKEIFCFQLVIMIYCKFWDFCRHFFKGEKTYDKQDHYSMWKKALTVNGRNRSLAKEFLICTFTHIMNPSLIMLFHSCPMYTFVSLYVRINVYRLLIRAISMMGILWTEILFGLFICL